MNLKDNMDLAEEFLKYLIQYALDNCKDDLEFLNNLYDKELLNRLQSVVEQIHLKGYIYESHRSTDCIRKKIRIPRKLGNRFTKGT